MSRFGLGGNSTFAKKFKSSQVPHLIRQTQVQLRVEAGHFKLRSNGPCLICGISERETGREERNDYQIKCTRRHPDPMSFL